MSEEIEENNISIKVTMVGSSGVGKTCITERFTKNEFDEAIPTTSGANYLKKEIFIDNKKIMLDIWDTAGQEKFHSLGRHFYKNSHIIILVYDLTNRESFDDIKNYWYNDIIENGEKYKVIGIVGNKIDLYDNKGVDEFDDQIVKDFVKSKSDEKETKIVSMKVSAKTGVNIKSLFEKLIKEYLKKEFNYLIRQGTLQSAGSFNISKKKKQKKQNCCE